MRGANKEKKLAKEKVKRLAVMKAAFADTDAYFEKELRRTHRWAQNPNRKIL